MTTPAPEGPPEPPIEFASLVQRCMGDAQFARAMLQMFAEQTPTMVRELRDQLTAGDLGGAAKVAHAIKGSAANVSARELSESAASIEDRCRARDVGTTSDVMDDLDAALRRCLSAIDVLVKDGSAAG